MFAELIRHANVNKPSESCRQRLPHDLSAFPRLIGCFDVSMVLSDRLSVFLQIRECLLFIHFIISGYVADIVGPASLKK